MEEPVRVPKGFRVMLATRQRLIDSLVCVGIDPLEEKLPQPFIDKFGGPTTEAMMMWLMAYVDATAPYASMFKPQRAYFEAMNCDGIAVLRFIVAYIHYKYPDIPVFLDCKRGDIARTQTQYGHAHMDKDKDGIDGMNYSPYMGSECLSGLCPADDGTHALVSLCYTSNESARETQEVLLADGRMYWEYIAEKAMEWSEKNGVLEDAGLVMAAAYERPKKSGEIYYLHLQRCREIVGDKMWFLIPGVGTQGGAVEETVRYGFVGYGSMSINSSSDILFSSQGYDFAEACAAKARTLRDKIRKVQRGMEAEAFIAKNGTIIGLTRDQLLAVNPELITWKLSQAEFFYLAKTLDACWFYDYQALDQGRPGLHAELKSERCSDGFFNSHELLQYPNILEIMAQQYVRLYQKYKAGHSLPEPTHVLPIPTGATKLGERIGEILGLPVIKMEKNAEGKLQLVSTIEPGAVILFIEDFCTKGTGFRECVTIIKEAASYAKFVPIELVMLNRGGLMYIEIEGVGIFVIAAIVSHVVSDWKPGQFTCPLCSRGSKPIKPKATETSWEEINASQQPS